MPLAAGQTLSFYEVLGPLGAGGMGEVWRARDTRLEREVAIKVLPEHFAADEDRLKRFEREAKTLATLHHPNVASIFGIDQVDDTCFLAMELVAGEDLAERLARGPLPLDEALEVCRQIAEGLEAAHEAGVIHRDLKPANVRVTPEGVVKLLDFGLAKSAGPRADGGSTSARPDSFLVTEEGLVLGTPTYMSPEQARGKPVDRRTDLWALGCVLYECLTGRRPFQGDSLADVLAAIVEREPDWSALPPLPARVAELLRRALTKDPRLRLRDAGEARVQLQLAQAEPAGAGAAGGAPPGSAAGTVGTGARPRRPAAWLVGALGLLAGAALGFALHAARSPAAAPPPPPKRLRVVLHEVESQTPWFDLALAPDGTHLAWTEPDGLHLRRLDALAATILVPNPDLDREGVPRSLVWSPDGRELAYVLDDALWRIPREGGPATLVSRADDLPSGGTNLAWAPDRRFLYLGGEGREELRAVPVTGGESTTVLAMDPERTEHFDGVCLLPDGSPLLLRHRAGVAEPDTIALLRDGELRDLVQLPGWELEGLAVGPDRLLFARNAETSRSLWSLAFSPASGEVLGEPALLVEGGRSVSAAADGTLAYVLQEGQVLVEPVWLDLQGNIEPFGRRLEAEVLMSIVSYDERRIYTSMPAADGKLWEHDLDRGVTTPVLELEKGNVVLAGGLPDGRIVLSNWLDMQSSAVARSGSSEPELLTEGLLLCLAPDGSRGLVMLGQQSDDVRLEILDLEGGGGTTTLQEDVARALRPDISPDGRWVLYCAEPAGERQIFLTRFEPGGRPWPVSTDGAEQAFFDESGELIYLVRGGGPMGEKLEAWSVTFQSEPEVRLGAPERVLELDHVEVMVTDFHRGEGRFIGARRLDPARRKIVLETGGR